VSTADGAAPLAAADVRALFSDLADCPVLVLAVSGGPDSTALMVLAARWRKALRRGPRLVAVTVDHGLRPQSRGEAAAVGRLARSLGVEHRILRWTGPKPTTGLQAAARAARYRLLAGAARRAGARHVLTAHTLDDQAETVLIRLARGSGIGGLAAMARLSPLPVSSPSAGGPGDIVLVRPLLEVPKASLVATLRRAGIAFADDASNRDPRFTRARLRAAMPLLQREGLAPQRLALLARRARRAEAALEAAVGEAATKLAPGSWPVRGPIAFAAAAFAQLPAEVALRLLGRAIARVGDEGPVELGKLESLCAGLAGAAPGVRFRRTLAGALVTRSRDGLVIERAPTRRRAASKPP
jgi:tRNA(Ile)-lysidine synthase